MMSFSMSNVLGVFMEFINKIFHPDLDQFVVMFIDDIMVYYNSNEEHVGHLGVVLQTL